MKTRIMIVPVFLLLLIPICPLFPQAGAGSQSPSAGEPPAADQTRPRDSRYGGRFSLEADMGSMGILSMFEAGFSVEPIPDHFFIRLKGRMASSLTWATYIPLDGSDPVSFHPVVAAGTLSFGGYSPFIRETFRMYGGTDLLCGYSFTPYEDLILDTGNLIGKNITFGVFGYFGVEVFTAPRLSVFLESGGGFKTLSGDDDNLYAVASSWLGSGFGIRTGVRWYP